MPTMKDEFIDSIRKSFDNVSEENKFEKLVECIYNFFNVRTIEEFAEFVEEELE